LRGEMPVDCLGEGPLFPRPRHPGEGGEAHALAPARLGGDGQGCRQVTPSPAPALQP